MPSPAFLTGWREAKSEMKKGQHPTIERHEHAVYYGATAMLKLKVFSSQIPGLYRCAVYAWFDEKLLFVSGSDSSLVDAKGEAAREAERHAGVVAGEIDWEPGQFVA